MIAALILTAAAWAAAAEPRPEFPQPEWLKAYIVTPYRETWTAELELDSWERGLAGILEAASREGASATHPVEAFASSPEGGVRQLSIAVPIGKARPLWKRLARLGRAGGPSVTPGPAPVPLGEIRAKIDALMRERVERKQELSRVPASAAASSEVLENLLRLEAQARAAPDAALFNLTLRLAR